MLEEYRPADDGTRQRIGQKYLEYQLSWFGKDYCEDDDMTFFDPEKAKERFIAFLEAYAESGAVVEGPVKMGEFRAQFIELFDSAFGKSDPNSRNYKGTKMNNLLQAKGIRYKVDGKPRIGPWTVIRFDWENESSDLQ